MTHLEFALAVRKPIQRRQLALLLSSVQEVWGQSQRERQLQLKQVVFRWSTQKTLLLLNPRRISAAVLLFLQKLVGTGFQKVSLGLQTWI